APGKGSMLVAQTGPDSGNSFRLKDGLNTVGRNPDTNNICINDPAIGRNHCTLRLNKGHITVHDLGSSNGTSINGDMIEGLELQSQDVVTTGGTRLVFLAMG
ncbi:MAG: FHA domain-containing protein, partial [Gammaproteobacteria bacterium]|nr:FHA domain-containing protein [Gammaproteobacteria bacterium]